MLCKSQKTVSTGRSRLLQSMSVTCRELFPLVTTRIEMDCLVNVCNSYEELFGHYWGNKWMVKVFVTVVTDYSFLWYWDCYNRCLR